MLSFCFQAFFHKNEYNGIESKGMFRCTEMSSETNYRFKSRQIKPVSELRWLLPESPGKM